MNIRVKSVRGSLVLSLGEAVVYGLSFIRNMILARMLTKSDFGIAAALALIITLFEFSAKLGISRFLVQDREGNREDFLNTAHFVQGAVSVLSSLLMAVAAWPLARLFSIPDHVAALGMLAAVPLLNGLNHLDVRRFERDLRFGPATLVEALPQVMITLAAWPVTAWLGDYRAVLVLLVAKAGLTCAGSHWLAERPYRWRLRREYALRMLRFGWPLLVTGFLMFGVLQGDQFLVAAFYTMADLGPYAAAGALTLAPSFFFGRVFNTVTLPVMAGVQDEPVAFERRYRLVIAVICAFSAAYAVGMILGAEALMRLIYGEKYAGYGVILGWLAAANSFRNVRIAPTIAAMAKGDSVNSMVSNLARVAALAPAAVVAVFGQPVWMIASTGLLGEALACAVSFRRLSHLHGVPLARSLHPTALVTVTVLLAGAAACFGAHHLALVPALLLAVVGAGLAGVVVTLWLEDSRRELLSLWKGFRGVDWRREWLRLKTGGAVRTRA
jgi:O-antigen/teichoic acid export membrane protein